MKRRLVATLAALLVASSSVGTQMAVRRSTTVAAIYQFPSYFHLQNVLLHGELVESSNARLVLRGGSRLDVSASGDFEDFHSTFVAVTAPSATVPPRSIVRLTTDQRVPVNAGSAAAQWSIDIGRVHALSAGFDWRAVKGDSEEDAYNAAPGPVTPPVQNSVLALHRVSGGTQRSAGVFVQDIMKMSRWTLTLSARGDWWKNVDAHNLETNIPSGTPTANNRLLASTSASVVSPRATALFRATDRINLWGSVGAGFRAPTLNELYRQFRVGTVLTLANELLGPERLTPLDKSARTLAAGAGGRGGQDGRGAAAQPNVRRGKSGLRRAGCWRRPVGATRRKVPQKPNRPGPPG